MVALVTSIDYTGLRSSIHDSPCLFLIGPIWILPYVLSDNPKFDLAAGHVCQRFYKNVVPRMMVQEHHGLMEPFVEPFFKRGERFHSAIEIRIARQHQQRCIFSGCIL